MTRTRDEKPDTWTEVPFTWTAVPGAHDIYMHVGAGVEIGAKASNVYVCHWHTPADAEARWQMSSCGLHDVHSIEPLHLEPSLACEDGCPSHGWIRNGRWENA